MWRYTDLIYLAAILGIISLVLMPTEVGSNSDEKQIGQTDGLAESDRFSELDQVIQLQSVQEMISQLSAQVSSIQKDDSNQKSETERLKSEVERQQSEMERLRTEMQEIQNESALKDRQMKNQLNSVADENQNLKQLLVKIMSANNQSGDFRREFNQYMDESGGVTYVRWGRTTCEGSAYPLYTGYAASGEQYPISQTPGGSADIVCLHNEPDYDGYISGGTSQLYGIEYDFDGYPFSTENNGYSSLKYNNMPCALCHVSSRSTQFMLPGRQSCPEGWVREYWGHLVSSHKVHLKNSLSCLDKAPEVVLGGAGINNGAMFTIVEAACKALLCPPYRPDYELTCSVCSK